MKLQKQFTIPNKRCSDNASQNEHLDLFVYADSELEAWQIINSSKIPE